MRGFLTANVSIENLLNFWMYPVRREFRESEPGIQQRVMLRGFVDKQSQLTVEVEFEEGRHNIAGMLMDYLILRAIELSSDLEDAGQ